MSQKVSAWEDIIPFINAGRKLSDSLREKTRKLVEQSNAYLTPFQDPLSLDFSSNRWFAGKREENFSDWLAWIIKQLDDPKLVFRLMDINAPSVADKCCKIPPEVSREFPVQKGHDDQSGKLDILIRYPTEALIVVEVKLGEADSADLKKNDGYYKSVEGKFEKESKYYKLLVIDAEKSKYNDVFEVLKWESVCIELRRMVADKIVKEALICALMLAFAGAVEENLLGLSSVKSNRFHSETVTYLQNSLPRGDTMDNDEDTQKQNVIKEGFLNNNYLNALYVIREFRNAIGKRIKNVIDSRLVEFSNSMKISLPGRDRIKEDNFMIGITEEGDSRIGWIIRDFDSDSPIDEIYVSMYFYSSNPKGTQSVLMSFYLNRNFDYFLKQCQNVCEEFEDWGNKEIGFEVYLTDLNSLENELNGVMDKWIDVWKRIGGVPGLLNLKA